MSSSPAVSEATGPTAPDSGPAWHALDVAAVLRRLGCDAATGLGSDDAARRSRKHGPNVLPAPPARTLFAVFLRQFKSPLIYLLFVAAALAAGMGHWNDALVIVAVVLVNAIVGATQEGRAERSMAALRRLSALQVRVLRDGREQAIAAHALVPGDILLLAAGDAVGADARVVEAAALAAAEAALTGESAPVPKSAAALSEATAVADRSDMVFSGTHIAAGRGRAVVTAIGAGTELGALARLTEAVPPPRTPLELRIAQFGRQLVVLALLLFALVMVLGLLRGLPFGDVAMVAISQTVSLVPEGLPVAMTIALAVGMQQMARRGAIVRRLAAVETLGSTGVICSDKTGTLTRNEMTVSALWLPGGRLIDVAGAAFGRGARPDSVDEGVAALLRAAVLCNDAPGLPAPGGPLPGDPTEAALLVAADRAGIDVQALRRQWPRRAELPFDADVKLMATGHAGPGDTRAVFVKGAPEAVLRLCAPDEAAARAARSAGEAMAGRALRVLAVAVVDDEGLDTGFDALAGRARLLGLIGELDPPREEVKAAVAECRAAGIRPIMVTGDHRLTGLAIARELGIARDGDLAVDGAELERMTAAELLAALDRIAVFARVHPAQKLRIVQALQGRGDVVAMTGDGVNDAPALARADVGVAMGRSGTEVAKSAADIVVGDDNFATIVAAVEQGRVVYANLKKVVLFLAVTSIDEVLVLLLALVLGYRLPLEAVQILWINIVTESTLTVNLAMDPADGDEMRRPPVSRTERLIDAGMLRRAALLAPTAVAATFGWFVWRQSGAVALDVVRTETFTVLALCQWFNVLNCQSALRSALRLPILRNRWLLAGLVLSVVLQAAVLYWRPLGELFHAVPIPPGDLLPLLAVSSLVLWTEELRKLLARRRLAGQPGR